MKIHQSILLSLLCLTTPLAMAQWQWVDANGRKVFSDQPPPADIPQKNILKQPLAPSMPIVSSTGSTKSDNAKSDVKSEVKEASNNNKDPELQKRLEQEAAAEQAKKKADEEKMAKAKAENCRIARSGKATLDSGRPMTQTGETGERVFLDQKQRDAETKRMQEMIARNC